MALKCVEGILQFCSQAQSRDFNGFVSPAILQYEDRILRQIFNVSSLSVWESDPNYHAYYNRSTIGKARTLEAAWAEYKRWPAPLLNGRLKNPVTDGHRSGLVFGKTRSFTPPNVRIPLTGGWVTHHVNESLHCIVNTTLRGQHFLYPGYVMRWLTLFAEIIISHSLARGIGMAPQANEVYRVQLFGDLDDAIKKSLSQRQ